MTSSTFAATVGGWASEAGDFALLAVATLFGFAIAYAIYKGALRFVLKRLHLIA